MISDPSVLLWAYGTSAFGWLLYKVMPPMVASWLAFASDRRIAALKAAQHKLIDDWGDDVAKKQQSAAQAGQR